MKVIKILTAIFLTIIFYSFVSFNSPRAYATQSNMQSASTAIAGSNNNYFLLKSITPNANIQPKDSIPDNTVLTVAPHIPDLAEYWTEFNPNTCKTVDSGKYNILKGPSHGRLEDDTERGLGIPGEGVTNNCLYTKMDFRAIYYTLTDPPTSNETQDSFTLEWYTTDGIKIDQAFTVTIGFFPNPNGFNFKNPIIPLSIDTKGTIINQNQYDLELSMFKQFYGNNLLTTTDGKLFEAASNDFKDYFVQDISGPGACFGMSGASAINYLLNTKGNSLYNQNNAGKRFAIPSEPNGYYNASFSDIDPISKTYIAADSIEYYQGVQDGNDIAMLQKNRGTPRENYNAIKQSLQQKMPIEVGIYGASGAHSVLAYRYSENVDDVEDVYVYDSNNNPLTESFYDVPPDPNGKIKFDILNNSWSYSPSYGSTWNSISPSQSNMNIVPITYYTRQGVPTWKSEVASNESIPPTLGAYISDSNGAVTGIFNGQLNEQATGVTLRPILSDASSTSSANQQFLTTIGNPYTIHITNKVGTQSPVDIFGNNAYISVNGLTPAASDSAQIVLGSDGKSVTVSASSKISNYSVELDQEVSGKSLVFTVSNVSLSPGETATFKLVGNTGALSIQNSGGNKMYTLEVHEIGGKNSILTFNTFGIGPNMTQTWVPTDWDNLENAPINLTIDKNSDGKSVSTSVANAITINNGGQYTNTTKVTLHLVAPFTATQMRLSNFLFDTNQIYDPLWQNFTSSLAWMLSGGEGKKTVYAQFKSASGSVSQVYSTNSIQDSQAPIIYGVAINSNKPATTSTSVQVKINSQDTLSGIQSMKVSNSDNLASVTWKPYDSSFSWSLTPLTTNTQQLRWVYVQLMDVAGNVSLTFKRPILLLPQ